MKKILMIASVDFHFTAFHIPYINYFKNRGIEVHIAAKAGDRVKELEDLGVVFHNIDFVRSPYSPKIFNAYFMLKKLMSKIKFDLVHVHTPVAAFLGRLAAKNTNTKPVLYTAHGFHFYKKAPILNWLIYYPLERIAAKWTDGLITINKEDYNRARDFKLREKDALYYVSGVGVPIEKYSCKDSNKQLKKEKMGFYKEDILVLSIGEFTKNKNQKQIIDAFAKIINSNLHLLFVGDGAKEKNLKSYVKDMDLSKNIHFLGYRRDIPDILAISDIFILTSKREGLPRAMMEAMATGLPIIATDIRGSRDLVKDGVNGYLVKIDDINLTAKALEKLINDRELRNKMGLNSQNIIKDYSIDKVLKEMKKIYEKYI
ncbi:glycosyltransferase family 4 protein [Defluviitalea phaphyphila]|uniref:glycosyltransferase family 4 protein n=1 Tax=Defluviitalea phaphyphila TaxID=1473580 RepID=UPI000731C83E|nr:glycosyltransferase family 4 protein [Defluviitalea phaphyphila]